MGNGSFGFGKVDNLLRGHLWYVPNRVRALDFGLFF
jgi:hypothetical protein